MASHLHPRIGGARGGGFHFGGALGLWPLWSLLVDRGGRVRLAWLIPADRVCH